MEMVYYQNLFGRGEVYQAVKNTFSATLNVLELENGAIGIIPDFVMRRMPDGVFDKPVEVQITGISDLYKALVLRPTYKASNPLFKYLVVQEGTIDLITPHGLGIDWNGKKLVFKCYQEFYTKMKSKDKVKFFMYADDDCSPQIWSLKEACINGVWVDFVYINKLNTADGENEVFPPVLFLKYLKGRGYYSEIEHHYVFDIPCRRNFCIYDKVNRKVLVEWDE